jgi:hypothetical protein
MPTEPFLLGNDLVSMEICSVVKGLALNWGNLARLVVGLD